MKIFLSAVSHRSVGCGSNENMAVYFVRKGVKFKYNLLSFYYIKNERDYEAAELVRDRSELVLIDSRAHSFQFGKKVDWDEYTKKYAEFIKKYDRDNVLGYFEMDIENIVGYEKVKELRRVLEAVSDKIIPVWHPLRGINDYEEMCKQYANKVIAIGGFRNTDIKDEQYINFLKTAKKYNCKVHCLGMTRRKVLDKIPFDFTDSSSWAQQSIRGTVDYGHRRKKVTKEQSRTNLKDVFLANYLQGIKMQEYYYRKWQNVCKD